MVDTLIIPNNKFSFQWCDNIYMWGQLQKWICFLDLWIVDLLDLDARFEL